MKARTRGALAVLAGGLVGTAVRVWYLQPAHPGLMRDPPLAAIDYALISIVVALLAMWPASLLIGWIADVEGWE